jgi:hypothetical protein
MASRSASGSYGLNGSCATLKVQGKRVRHELRSSATILTGYVAGEDGERDLMRLASQKDGETELQAEREREREKER